jgi:hypothetical protein
LIPEVRKLLISNAVSEDQEPNAYANFILGFLAGFSDTVYDAGYAALHGKFSRGHQNAAVLGRVTIAPNYDVQAFTATVHFPNTPHHLLRSGVLTKSALYHQKVRHHD